MEYSNKELNEIREAGYNHGYSVGYNESTYNIESEVSKLLNESLEESAKNLNMAAAGYDEGWYAGEMNAYEKVFNFIEKLKEKDLEASKRVIGYDDFGKPLHEGDFCTFDVNAADWRFKPDNIQKSGLATLEGQVTYDEQDKCFEISIDNEYCPALYFHAIEPGTLRVKNISVSKKITNADKIRAMSDDELTDFINTISGDSMATISYGTQECSIIWENKTDTLKWLQTEI